jgi:nucleoside 2-deoxyribosyltransferase
MVRIFVSYRFTGENLVELKKLIQKVCNALNKAGYENYCTMWDSSKFKEKKFTGRQIMEHAFKEIDNSEVFLLLVKSEKISEGMLIEAGYAFAKKKKVLLFINKNVKHHILKRLFNDSIIDFKDIEDLENKLAKLKI